VKPASSASSRLYSIMRTMLQPIQLGPYRIEKSIGKGGMGSVYAATDINTGQKVAVKALNPHLAQVDGFRERFEAEIDSLKTLRHEGIVRLYGWGEEEGRLFYSMEIIPGTSLEDELKAGRRFDWREVSDIAIQLSMALKHAHDHGIIHRDIKPANILFADDTHVKLADFGIARLFGSNNSLTSAGGVLGTADYMSPEQADGRPVNARCDQYSLGGVMYALLTGRPPFRAKNLPEMLQLQRFAQPEPVSRYAPDTPKQLEQVIAQLLAKDPADRFPNTAVLARHLQAMVNALSRPAHDSFALATDPADAAMSDPDWRDPLALAVTQTETSLPPGSGDAAAGREKAQPLMTANGRGNSRDGTTLADGGAAGKQGSEGRLAPIQASAGPTAPSSGTTVFTTVDEEFARQRQQSSRSWTAVLIPASVLVIALAALGALALYLMHPYTADQLYAHIATHTDSDDVDSIRQVEKEIKEFVSRFPDDPRVAELRQSQQRVQLERMSRRLQLQSRRGGLPDLTLLPVEVLYLQAMNTAQTSPEAAIKLLDSLVKLYGSDANADDAAAGETDRRAQCVKLAQQQLATLRADMAKQTGRQLAAIRERLEAAGKIGDRDSQRGREMLQAVIDLYGKDEWATGVVTEAKQMLAQLDVSKHLPDDGKTGQRQSEP
jgi:eukaryotic-like serine/threonine-protein kinase